jgi:hypothetical protein
VVLCWLGGPPLGVPFLVYWASLLLTFPVACWVLRSAARDDTRESRWSSRKFELVWGVLLTVDLWSLVWPLVAVHPQEPIFAPPNCVQSLIRGRRDHQRVLDRSIPGHPGSTPLGFAIPLLDRIDQVRGYNHIDIHRYKEYIQFVSDRDEPVQPAGGIENFPIINKKLLDLLGVRYLLQPSEFPRLAGESVEVANDPRWQQRAIDSAPEAFLFVEGGLGRLPGYTLYENREAFPRAFVVPRAESLPEQPRVLKALKKADFRQVVFLEHFRGDSGSSHPAGRFQAATITAFEPNHVVVEAELAAPGYLVLTDPWYPGWTSTVDGQSVPLFRADYVFRAVAVPAGKHRIHFNFDPAYFRLGKKISFAAMAAVLGLSLSSLALRLRSRSDRDPAPDRCPGDSTSVGVMS